MKGYVHSFESLAAVDGAGLRYAVFLSGCPLRCVYCHNPDTWEIGGQEIEAEALVKKISRFKPYFKNNGGVTISGGEPLMQSEFICDVAEHLKDCDINYCIDTSGAVLLTDSVKKAIDLSELVLLDLKFWDNESYKKYTGVEIYNTLKTLDYLEETQKRTWIRTVIVPGINDVEDKLDKYIEHIKDKKCVEKYELLAFHTMGFYKYTELGAENKLSGCEALPESVKEKLQAYVNKKLNN